MKSNSMLFSHVAINVRHARKAKGWTQLDVAQALGITTRAVQLWESGRALPSGKNLKALADELDREREWFYDNGAELERAA